jgi:rRNA maturation RNase YbeY
MPAGAAELSVVLCSDAHIMELNRQWRNKAEATDVLSFEMDQDGLVGYPVRVLGDLVISLDTAQRQAHERGCVSQPTRPVLWASYARSP